MIVVISVFISFVIKAFFFLTSVLIANIAVLDGLAILQYNDHSSDYCFNKKALMGDKQFWPVKLNISKHSQTN